MLRNSRRSSPRVPPKLNVELNQKHIWLRGLGFCVALLIAALAFGSMLQDYLRPQAGWQQIEPEKSETGITQEFYLCYFLGKSGQNTATEQKAVSSLYSRTLEHGYRALVNLPVEGYVNLYTLNSQPNTTLTVEPLLYAALEAVEASGNRMLYYAPLMEQYHSLFSCTYDSEAEQFDPDRSEEAGRFAREIAGFASDSSAVQIKLLPENQVRLEISERYLDYARENEVGSFVDFGILRNAFLCDAVADALEAQGYVNGYITSFDGYARSLCPEEFGLNILDWTDGKPAALGTVLYDGPCALVSCRSFPVLEEDGVNYFTYSDGTVCGPYLNREGLARTAGSSLSALSPELGAGELALRTLAAFTGEDSTYPTLQEVSWVSGDAGEIHYNGEGFRPAQ